MVDGKKINIRGAGHSFNQINLGSQLLIINYKGNNHCQLNGDTFTVNSSVTVEEAELFLQKNGKHMVCLQDRWDLTIGGSVCVSGMGWESVRYGTQADQVMSFKLVQPNGKELLCSRNSNEKLFLYSLAGLGQLGFIKELTIQVFPYLPWYKLYIFSFPTIKEMLDTMEEWGGEDFITDEIDFFHGGCLTVLDSQLRVYIGKRFTDESSALKWPLPPHFTTKYLQLIQCRQGSPAKLSKYTVLYYLKKHQSWTDFFLPDFAAYRKTFKEYFAEIYEEPIAKINLHPRFKNLLYLNMLIAHRPSTFLPLGVIPSDSKKYAYGIGVYFQFDDKKEFKTVELQIQNLLTLTLSNKGRSYNYGSHKLTKDIVEKMYGDYFSELKQLKNELDPKHQWNGIAGLW